MLGRPLALMFGDIYKINQQAALVRWWEAATGPQASAPHLAPSLGHVFGKYHPKEITHLSSLRGEQHDVSAARGNLSRAALFSELLKEGPAAALSDPLPAGEPRISSGSLSQLQPSSQTHLFHTF